MYFTQLLAIVSTAVIATAAPTTVRTPIQIGADDVILYGNGRYQLMKRVDFTELDDARKNSTVLPMPGYLNVSLFHGPPAGTTNEKPNATTPSSSLEKRKNSATIIIKNPASRFLGWDIQMSAVVKGAQSTGTSISVTSGYTVANSISVGVATTFTLIESFLSASVSVDYSTTWTSSQSQVFQASVAAGKYGAWVSNAWTNRQSGYVFQGVIGEDSSPSYYQGDSFESKSFDSLAWVDGVISLCTGEEFPLKRCLGDGTL
jgi:hypothetical protein